MTPLRILLSYWYVKTFPLASLALSLESTHPYEVFLDSGAFSAMTCGATLSITEYARYITENASFVIAYANLDVIRNGQKTWDNQKIMEEEHGLSPVPVFHVAEPWKWLERYIEQYPYIALGVAGMRAREYFPWLVKCFAMAKGTSVLFHGFGITAWNVLKAFPWHSVDSSTWGKGFRYGRVPLFTSETGCISSALLSTPSTWERYRPYLRGLGFDPADFSERSRQDRKKICALSAYAYLEAERWLLRRWGPSWRPGERTSGPKLYFVDTNPRLVDIKQVLPLLMKEEEYG